MTIKSPRRRIVALGIAVLVAVATFGTTGSSAFAAGPTSATQAVTANAGVVLLPTVVAVTAGCPSPGAGRVLFTNPGAKTVVVVFGSLPLATPDGFVYVAAGSSVVVQTTRTSLDWFAASSPGAGSGSEVGMGQVVVPQTCVVIPPPPVLVPPGM